MMDDGDLRMLGARDGYVHSLIALRNMIARYDGLYVPRIHPRHTRKLAQRAAIVAPLRELEKRLVQDLENIKSAYAESRKPIAVS